MIELVKTNFKKLDKDTQRELKHFLLKKSELVISKPMLTIKLLEEFKKKGLKTN